MAGENREIPAAEMDVLRTLWKLKTGTVREVMEELAARHRRLAYTTVLTLLTRLERKGCVVRVNKEGLADVYRPKISRQRVTADRLGALVEQLGDGQALPLVLQLVQTHKLSADDIKHLRRLLLRLEEEADE
jgi:BlaI family transcriptional regulator, penicillinase repressor